MLTLRTALVMLFAVAITSCGDDAPTNYNGNNNNNNTTFTNKAAGTLNGESWAATSVLSQRNAVGGFVPVTFVAHGANNTQLAFGIANASVNTFTVTEGSANQASFDHGGKSYGKNETGTIKIDAITDKGMRGSFNITVQTNAGESGTAVGTFEASF